MLTEEEFKSKYSIPTSREEESYSKYLKSLDINYKAPSPIDWEQRKFELIKVALSGLLPAVAIAHNNDGRVDLDMLEKRMAFICNTVTDMVISKLKDNK